MILITSAKYCPSEFLIEFGKLVPSFLPLANKRLYEYQIALFKENSAFKDENIVLSLPESFKPNKADLKRLETLKIKLLFVPDGLSLGQSINYALCMNLPLKSLQILHGDTYLSKLSKAKNALGVSKALNNYDWAFLNQNKNLRYKLKNLSLQHLDNLILNGYFNIEHPYAFMRYLNARNYDFMQALNEYSKEFAFEVAFNDTWLDFGLVSSYFQSKKSLTTQRAFNELKIEDNFVLKTSNLKNKIEAEIAWFQALPQKLSFYIPKFIIQNKSAYKTQYLYLNTLSELYVFSRLSLLTWERILTCTKSFLDKLHSLKKPSNLKLNFNYKQKSLERLKAFSRQHHFNLSKALTLEFRGETFKLPSILNILDILDESLPKKQDFCFIHGDFCFSNIMFDFRSNEPICFDPRGLDFDGQVTAFGDKNYDFAKLAHSLIGLYDFLIAGFFELEFKDYHFKFELEESLVKGLEESFFKIFKLDRKMIYALIIHLFLSMLPLHEEDKTRQFAFLANALRLFTCLENLKQDKKDEK